jgi:HK97 family phage prohead protease
MNRRKQMLRSFSAHPWAMHPRALAALYRSVMDGMDDAVPLGDEALAPEAERESGVLVLPIRGTIVHHWTDGMMAHGLVTPTEWLIDALDRAEVDPAISGVVLDIDSGGGMAAGTPEAAERIFRFRQSGKPIVAVANSFAASAAYYLGAAASEFYVTPSGEVGSIGTLMIHEDVSEMLANIGVRVEILRATEAENKARINPFEPLSDEERAHAQAQLDAINARFLADVARFRALEPDTVAEVSDNGRTFLAEAAVAAGLVDGVRTLREVVAEVDATSKETADPTEPEPVARSLPDGAEVRSLDAVEVRAVGEGAATLAGTALNYGARSVDLGGFVEEFAPGSFGESLGSDDVRVLWQHDGRYVFGRVRAGTAKVWSDDAGLHYEATPPKAQWAEDAMESIRRGDVSANSFGFIVPKGGDKWERRNGELVRTVTRARLIEVGPQTNPAYPDTTVAVRGMQAFLTEERRAQTELCRRKLAMVQMPEVR